MPLLPDGIFVFTTEKFSNQLPDFRKMENAFPLPETAQRGV
jgi:hypothetical protein